MSAVVMLPATRHRPPVTPVRTLILKVCPSHSGPRHFDSVRNILQIIAQLLVLMKTSLFVGSALVYIQQLYGGCCTGYLNIFFGSAISAIANCN